MSPYCPFPVEYHAPRSTLQSWQTTVSKAAEIGGRTLYILARTIFALFEPHTMRAQRKVFWSQRFLLASDNTLPSMISTSSIAACLVLMQSTSERATLMVRRCACITSVYRAPAAAANQLRPGGNGLGSAVRWVRWRVQLVHPCLRLLTTLLPDRFGGVEPTTTAFAAVRGEPPSSGWPASAIKWDGLQVFLTDGRVELNSNIVEHLRSFLVGRTPLAARGSGPCRDVWRDDAGRDRGGPTPTSGGFDAGIRPFPTRS